MQVRVVYALPDVVHDVQFRLDDGATVGDALSHASKQPPFDQLPLDEMPVGVYGERCNHDRVLRDHDRVELYRPLQVDPMVRRRARA